MAICALDSIPIALQPVGAGPLPGQVSVTVQVSTKDIETALKSVPKDRWAIATISLEVEAPRPAQ
jgi:hypothetical protein